MSQAKLEAARQLINELKYNEARAILRTMPDNPTAQDWLAKLARIAPEAPPPGGGAPSSIYTVDPQRPPSAPSSPRPASTTYRPDPPSAARSPAPPPGDSPALRRARRRVGWLRLQLLVWGTLWLGAIAWAGFGVLSAVAGRGGETLAGSISAALMGVVETVTGPLGGAPVPGVDDAARGIGGWLGGALTVSFFLCTGLPLFFIIGGFYRRTAAVLRDERQHKEVLESMERRST